MELHDQKIDLVKSLKCILLTFMTFNAMMPMKPVIEINFNLFGKYWGGGLSPLAI